MSFKEPIDQRFDRFHRQHPEVYAHLVRLARTAKDKGRTKLGIKMLYEVVRWNVWLETGTKPKLSNDYHARYSRLIMANEADLDGMFDLRELREHGSDTDADHEIQNLDEHDDEAEIEHTRFLETFA